MTDEEIRAIEKRIDARQHCHNFTGHEKFFDPVYICSKCNDVDQMHRDIEELFDEVTRLRSGWQSVADGAKPEQRDWYVSACIDRERDFNTNAEKTRVRVEARYPMRGLPDGSTHFLVIPPPPIERES